MLTKIKKIKPMWVVILLLSLNVAFFGVSSSYFNGVTYDKTHEGVEVTENDYVESGWRLVNWSLSMFRFLNGNQPQGDLI